MRLPDSLAGPLIANAPAWGRARRALTAGAGVVGLASGALWVAPALGAPPIKGAAGADALVPAALLAACGGLLVLAAVPTLLLGLATRAWSRVDGHVVVSDDVVEAQEQATWQRPVVAFQYAVGQRTRYGSTVRYGWARLRDSDRYAPGERVSVWVSLRDPERAVLERGPCAYTTAQLAVGLGCVLAAAGALP